MAGQFRFNGPAGGFEIIIDPRPLACVEAECAENPKLAQFWDAFLERLKFTALKEGQQIDGVKWTYIAEGAKKFGVPTMQVLFTHDMWKLYIHAAYFWQDGEGEDAED